ncbi:nucleotidyltransferase domain-containing protein [Candidatus Micrarchaeota archaeon]|nr:nucleotidyltransferase domain-containing protein [Candidatus Micrarchaeota archaeon]
MADALDKAVLRFEARIRKVSESLVITIPKQQADALNFKSGQTALVEMIKINEDELKKQKQEEGLRTYFGEPYHGALYYNNVKIAELDAVFCKEDEYRTGGLGEGQPLDSLPIARSFSGIISRGKYLSSGFKELHSDKGDSVEWISRSMDGFNRMEIERGSEKLIFEPAWFEQHSVDLLESKRIDNLRFDAPAKNVKKTDSAIDPLKKILEEFKQIKFAFVYGSIARGTFTKNSDIDVLIIGVENNKMHERIFELQKTTARPINYMIWSKEKFRKKLHEGDGLLKEIIRNNIEWLHGDNNEFERIIEREMDRKEKNASR